MKATSKPYIMAIGLFLGFCLSSMTVFAHTHTDSCYSDPSHVHTEACYSIVHHEHTEECMIRSCSGDDKVSIEIVSDLFSQTCPNGHCSTNMLPAADGVVNAVQNATRYTKTCLTCGASTTYVKCGACGTIIEGSDQLNHQTITLEYSLAHPDTNIICSKTDEKVLTCGQSGDTRELICGKTITNVVPSEQVQSGTFNNEVIVTYLDEHTERVKAESSTYDSSKTYDSEAITLTYKGFSCQVLYSSTKNTTQPTDISSLQQDFTPTIKEDEYGVKIKDETTVEDISQIKDETVFEEEQIEIKEEKETEQSIEGAKVVPLEQPITEQKDNVKNISKKSSLPIIILGTIVAIACIGGIIVTRIRKHR